MAKNSFGRRKKIILLSTFLEFRRSRPTKFHMASCPSTFDGGASFCRKLAATAKTTVKVPPLGARELIPDLLLIFRWGLFKQAADDEGMMSRSSRSTTTGWCFFDLKFVGDIKWGWVSEIGGTGAAVTHHRRRGLTGSRCGSKLEAIFPWCF